MAATVAAGILLAGPAAATARPDHPNHPGRTAHASHSGRSGHVGPAHLALESGDRAERGSHTPARGRPAPHADHAHPSANGLGRRGHAARPPVAAASPKNGHGSGNGRGIGRLLGQLAGTANGLINGASSTVNEVTHTTGTLLGAQPDTGASTPPRSPTGPASPSSRLAGPASGAQPASAHREALATVRDAVAKHQPRLRAAPAEMPALVGRPSPEVDRTASPAPSSTAVQTALPVLPVSAVALLAPRVWVLVLAIGLFALGVLFLVLGAGYRARRAR